jgi:hypothetical protein
MSISSLDRIEWNLSTTYILRLYIEKLIYTVKLIYVQALADMMENDTQVKWGNWIGYVLLPFTIGLRDDPLDYVREAKATIDRKKHSFEAIYTFSIAELVLKLFGIKVEITLF